MIHLSATYRGIVDGAAANTGQVFTPALLAVHPGSGAAGTQVTVTGSGFCAGEPVTLTWDGGSTLARVKTTRDGGFSTTVTVLTAPAGAHVITAPGGAAASPGRAPRSP
jgi:hypothetical protein